MRGVELSLQDLVTQQYPQAAAEACLEAGIISNAPITLNQLADVPIIA